MILGMYFNIKIKKQKISKKKLITSGIKLACVVIGITLMCIVITTLPMFISYVGISIPDQYMEIFSNLIIVIAFVYATCQYIKDAYEKLKEILGIADLMNTEEEFMCPYYQEMVNIQENINSSNSEIGNINEEANSENSYENMSENQLENINEVQQEVQQEIQQENQIVEKQNGNNEGVG